MSLNKINIWGTAKAKEGSCQPLEMRAQGRQTCVVVGTLFNEVSL